MVALMARMLVCSASSDTISSTAPICCDFLPSSSMWLTIRSTCRRIPAMDSCALATVLVARARRDRGLLGDLGDPLRALGDLARGGEELADGRADLAHRRGLLLDAGRLLVGGRLQLRRRALHLADRRADLPAQRVRQKPSHAADEGEGESVPRTRANVALCSAAFTSSPRCLSSARSSPSIWPMHSTQLVHQLLALTVDSSFIAASNPAFRRRSMDRASSASFEAIERLHLVNPLLLLGIAGGQGPELLHERGHRGRPVPIAVEKRVVTCDDKPSLSRSRRR